MNPYQQSITELFEDHIHACTMYNLKNKERINTDYCFNTETRKNGFQDFVQENISAAIKDDLYLIKESTRVKGAIDFIGFDKEARIFFIEVKCTYDQRARFDVIFQCIKYCLKVDSEIETDLKSQEDEIANKFDFDAYAFEEWLRKVSENFKNHQVNPIIVTDRITPQLFATAYSIYLRGYGGEIRIIEMNLQRISEDYLVFVRKYNFSNNDWLGGDCKNNRKPTEYVDINEKLLEIDNENARDNLIRLNNELSFKMSSPSKSQKCITIVPHMAYFSFDPNGKMPQGMYEKTDSPKKGSVHRIMFIKHKLPHEAQVDIPYKIIESSNKKHTYLEYSFEEPIPDTEFKNLISLLEQLHRSKPQQ